MNKPKEEKVKILQNPEEPIETEVLANHIVKISEGFKKLLNGGLRQETIVLLIHAHTNVGKPAIRDVLKTLPLLRQLYTAK